MTQEGYAPHTEKALLGLAYYKRNNEGEWVLRPRWKALGISTVVLLFVIYFAAVNAFYCFNRYYRECEETSYSDMFLYVIPNRIPFTKIIFLPEFINQHIVNARLRQQARLGDMLFKNPSSIYDLIAAARLSPDNLDAQLQAARLFLAPGLRINRIEEAFDALDLTVPRALQSKDFFLQYAQLAFHFDQDRRIIASAEQYLDDPAMSADARIVLATSYAEALFLRGELLKSEAVLKKYDLYKTLSGILLASQIMWENGEKNRAINFLTRINTELGNNPAKEKVLYSLAKFYWEENRNKEAAQVLQEISRLHPSDFRSRIYTLVLLDNPEERQAAIETILRQFGSNEGAMLALGGYAADKGNVELQDRVYALSIQNRFKNLSNFRLLKVETLLMAKKNTEVIEDISNLLTTRPNWLEKDPVIQSQFDSLRMLAYYSNNQPDLGNIRFKELLNSPVTTVPMLVSIARRLQTVNRPEEAEQLLRKAYVRNHNNLGALLELVKISLKSEDANALGQYLGNLLEARRPPRYILQSAYERISSDRFLFTPNREKLIEEVSEMLRTRVLPANEVEKQWPSSPL